MTLFSVATPGRDPVSHPCQSIFRVLQEGKDQESQRATLALSQPSPLSQLSFFYPGQPLIERLTNKSFLEIGSSSSWPIPSP